MTNDLKRMNGFLLAAFILMFAFAVSLMFQLEETSNRADALAAQVYTLGSMLGERNAANQAESVIREVVAYD